MTEHIAIFETDIWCTMTPVDESGEPVEYRVFKRISSLSDSEFWIVYDKDDPEKMLLCIEPMPMGTYKLTFLSEDKQYTAEFEERPSE